MSYWDADLTERRHRQAILERKFAFHDNYGALDTAIEGNLANDYDRRLRASHAAFLNAATRSDISWMSPSLEKIASDSFVDEILLNIRNDRSSSHLTERMGSVPTSAGKVYWAIRKPRNIRELVRAAWKRSPFQLGLWHADDVINETPALPLP